MISEEITQEKFDSEIDIDNEDNECSNFLEKYDEQEGKKEGEVEVMLTEYKANDDLI